MPFLEDATATVHHGDCLDVLAAMPAESVDAVVTDPPYGLEFMGKEWDRFDEDSNARAGMSRTGYTDGAERLERPSFLGGLNPKCRTCQNWQRGGNPCICETPDFPNERRARSAAFGDWCQQWAVEALRVLKPGGHLLAFGGTRTWHRLTVAVEDAGFEIRDSIAWLYGSGFPKSLDVSKAIDKAAGAVREIGGSRVPRGGSFPTSGNHRNDGPTKDAWRDSLPAQAYEIPITAPATDAARQWSGWGTALKPAFEPIVVARKPLAGTVAANVQAHGVGALNIDGCRIGTDPIEIHKRTENVTAASSMSGTSTGSTGTGEYRAGRWPANVILDESQAAALDEQSGVTRSSAHTRNNTAAAHNMTQSMGKSSSDWATTGPSDLGGASRFFYCAKAPKRERPTVDGVSHPTVKPLTLMRYLVRLVTPPGGTVLDPFAGSGATLEAALLERARPIGIERAAEYLPLIMERITRAQVQQADVDEPLTLFDETA